MLIQRILTAVVLLILLLLLSIYSSPFQFACLTLLVLLGAGYEWTRFIGLDTPIARVFYLLSLLILALGLFLLLGIDPKSVSLDSFRVNSVLLLGVLFWMLVLILLRGYPANAGQWNDSSRIALMGILVLLPTWVGLVQLKYLNPTGLLVLAIISLVSVADIGAFFVGRKWGKRKLAPELSPKKSWAGVWGSLGSTTLYAVACVLITNWYLLPLSLPTSALLVLGSIPVVMISIAGDLFESMLKRNRGLKDSGSILPGHGGIMDRIDSLTAAIPLYVLLLALLFQGQVLS
ncbi:MAG: phosphatidate cytidylyltransferase [Pseudohongiellaceae bacterium]